MSALDTLKDVLGPHLDKIDETTLEYMAGILDDGADEDAEELVDALVPYVGECVEDEEECNELCKQIISTLRGEAAPVKQEPAKLLSGPVKMSTSIKASEEQIDIAARQTMNVSMGNYNDVDLGKGVNTEIREDEDEHAMKMRIKTEKRQAKREKRDLRRLKLQAMQTDEMMKELTRDPVVLHWKGQAKGNNDIRLKDACMEIMGNQLMEDTDITVAYGRRYGLVGRNGIGKTTFLRFLSAHKFEGMPEHLQVLHIEQEVPDGEMSVLECVLATDIERTALLAEEKELLAEEEKEKQEGEEMDLDDEADRRERLNEIYERLEEIDAATAPKRAAEILAGLGFTPKMQQTTLNRFSGGWRMRVSLARALFIHPDVLLLDEPTNHLDLHAVLWLEEYLQDWSKTLIVVSHARSFLNEVCTDILLFANKTIQRYKGNYDKFEETRSEDLRQNEKQREATNKQMAHMQQFIDKFRANSKRASMVQSRIKALSRMEVVAEIISDPTLQFHFPNPEPLAPPVIQLVDVTFGYPDCPTLFENVNLGLDLDSRVCLVGPNGIGKSTLLKLVVGDLEPNSGQVNLNGRLRIGRFSQHHVDQLDLNLSALEGMKAQWPDAKSVEIRSHLGTMGLGGSLALQPMRTLSGGQKSRAAFAQIMWRKPHVLLLDEPTNHLDLDAVEALIQALMEFEGGLLVVSHDQHLISSVCETLWVAEPGSVRQFNGEFEEYKRKMHKSAALSAK